MRLRKAGERFIRVTTAEISGGFMHTSHVDVVLHPHARTRVLSLPLCNGATLPPTDCRVSLTLSSRK